MMALMMRGMRGDRSDKATDPRAHDQEPSASQFEAKGHDHGNPR